MTSGKDGYCGLVCGELLEDQQKILDLCIEHAKYDPVFAPIMIQKLIDKCKEAQSLLLLLLLLVGIKNVERPIIRNQANDE